MLFIYGNDIIILGDIMKLTIELFKNYNLIENNLLNYGFIMDNNTYLFKKNIHNNEFELNVFIKDKKIDSNLIDLSFNEEYKLIDNETSGSFISSLKEECEKVLIDIRNKCYYKDDFKFPQSNRISNLIKEKYNAYPEFLWDNAEGSAIFRNKDNEKWFAIIMDVNKNRLVKDENELVEVINLKLDELVETYLKKKGIYKAYHMSKKNWVSIILDDTLKDSEIMDLVDISYNKINVIKYYLVPANPMYYDIEHAFDNTDIINWKQGKGIKVNDIIFMYVAKPVQAILYMCKVVETNIEYEYRSKELNIDSLMKIKLLKTFNSSDFTYDDLVNKYHISFIRGPRLLTKELLDDLLNK